MSTDLAERLASTTLRDLLDGLRSDKPASDNTPLHRLELEWGPIEHLAYYSCDESDKVTFDLSCLHKFNQPSSLRLPVDLSRGRELFHARNKHNRTLGHPVPLDNLARACVKLGKEKELRGADVVSWRGVLVKLMLGVRLDLRFYCVEGTLYLLEFDQRPDALYHNQLKEGYHGYAFEALCTQTEDGGATGSIPTLDVWKCIVRRTFGDLDVVFGAEVDCVDGNYENSSDNLMELKTEILSPPYQPSRADQKKKKKWYLQSYLIGIPEIFVGYRDREFILHKVERVPLNRVYAPPSGTMDEAYELAYQVLRELRAFCRREGLCERGSEKARVHWRVTVRRGVLLGLPQMV